MTTFGFRGFTVAAIAALAALAGATAAGAAPGAMACNNTLVSPFAGDRASYYAVPNGDFESVGGWTTSTGLVQYAADDAQLEGFAGGGSLRLDPGTTAFSGTFCAEHGKPFVRLQTKGLAAGAAIQVVVQYATPNGFVDAVRSEVIAAPDGTWATTDRLVLLLGIGVAVRDTPPIIARVVISSVGAAPVQVDNVYIDPRKRV